MDGKYSLPTGHNLMWRIMSGVLLGSVIGIDIHVKKLVHCSFLLLVYLTSMFWSAWYRMYMYVLLALH